MSSQDKAPKKKNPQKITGTSDKKEDKKIKKNTEEQLIPEKAERQDQKDELGNQKGFENEPLKEEDIDSLFML